LSHRPQIARDPDAFDIGVAALRAGLRVVLRRRHFNTELLG